MQIINVLLHKGRGVRKFHFPLDHNCPELMCNFNYLLSSWHWLVCGWNWMEQNLAGLNIRMHFSCLSTQLCHFTLHSASLIYATHTEETEVHLLNKNNRKIWGSYINKTQFITILKTLLCQLSYEWQTQRLDTGKCTSMHWPLSMSDM